MISAKRSGDALHSVHDLKAMTAVANLCQFVTWLLPERGGVAFWLGHSVTVRSKGIWTLRLRCISTGEPLSLVAGKWIVLITGSGSAS
jgi:hypothetical protein